MNSNFETGEVSVDQDYSEDLIRVGSSYFSKCPMCGECFSLKWPYRLQQIPSNSIVHLECPQCKHEYTEIAKDINQAAAQIRLSVGLVRRIEPQ